jgi:hypothetical protein
LIEQGGETTATNEQNHYYYQGMLVVIGNLRGFSTFVPNQDKNRLFVRQPLDGLRTLREIPNFSYDPLVRRSSTVDVIWFNKNRMPDSFFEVEHSTDMQNSLLKFYELRDFHARMVIVSHQSRKAEFDDKVQRDAFGEIKDRVDFLGYELLARQYEFEVMRASQPFVA